MTQAIRTLSRPARNSRFLAWVAAESKAELPLAWCLKRELYDQE